MKNMQKLRVPENLESRQLLTVTTSLDAGTLSVTSDGDSDSIEISRIQVAGAPTLLAVSYDGLEDRFLFSDVESIDIELGDGDDELLIHDDAQGAIGDTIPLTIDAGDGDDLVVASSGGLSADDLRSFKTITASSNEILDQVNEIVQLANSELAVPTTDIFERANQEVFAPLATLLQEIPLLTDADSPDLMAASEALIGSAQDLERQLTSEYVEPVRVSLETLGRDLEGELGATVLSQAEGFEAQANSLELELAERLEGEVNVFAGQLEEEILPTVEELDPLVEGDGDESELELEIETVLDQLEPLTEGLTEVANTDLAAIEAYGIDVSQWTDGLAEPFLDRADALALAIADIDMDDVSGSLFIADIDQARVQLEADAAQFVLEADAYTETAEGSVQSTVEMIDADAQLRLADAAAEVEASLRALLDNVTSRAAGLAQLVDGAASRQVRAFGDQCSPSHNTISGGAGFDFLVGTNANDDISDPSGFNVMLGRGGNDLMSGGSGTDFALGGNGDDCMNGNGGIDVMFGGNGRDEMLGGDALDLLVGNAGPDEINGNAGFDIVVGGSGTDTIDGGANTDILLGGDDADTMNGSGGVDIMIGGAGGDTMNGGELRPHAWIRRCRHDARRRRCRSNVRRRRRRHDGWRRWSTRDDRPCAVLSRQPDVGQRRIRHDDRRRRVGCHVRQSRS